jgi:hypothetical protein
MFMFRISAEVMPLGFYVAKEDHDQPSPWCPEGSEITFFYQENDAEGDEGKEEDEAYDKGVSCIHPPEKDVNDGDEEN